MQVRIGDRNVVSLLKIVTITKVAESMLFTEYNFVFFGCNNISESESTNIAVIGAGAAAAVVVIVIIVVVLACIMKKKCSKGKRPASASKR